VWFEFWDRHEIRQWISRCIRPPLGDWPTSHYGFRLFDSSCRGPSFRLAETEIVRVSSPRPVGIRQEPTDRAPPWPAPEHRGGRGPVPHRITVGATTKPPRIQEQEGIERSDTRQLGVPLQPSPSRPASQRAGRRAPPWAAKAVLTASPIWPPVRRSDEQPAPRTISPRNQSAGRTRGSISSPRPTSVHRRLPCGAGGPIGAGCHRQNRYRRPSVPLSEGMRSITNTAQEDPPGLGYQRPTKSGQAPRTREYPLPWPGRKPGVRRFFL